MSGLVLKLAPKERILLNGAVIENGDRRGKLKIVTPNAAILRLRDAIHPSDAKTPASRLAYIAQLGLTGDVASTACRSQLLRGLAQLRGALIGHGGMHLLDEAERSAQHEEFYACLKILRRVMRLEAELMANSK